MLKRNEIFLKSFINWYTLPENLLHSGQQASPQINMDIFIGKSEKKVKWQMDNKELKNYYTQLHNKHGLI